MSREDTTNQLLRQARDGNRRAVEQLFESHRPYLRRVIDLRMEGDLAARLDASDIVQETQVRAFNRLDSYLEKQDIEFRLWLRGQALDRLAELRRYHLGSAKRALRREVQLSGDDSAMLVRQLFGSSPSESVIRRETVDGVRQAVGKLSDRDRELLLLRHFEGLSNQETAQVLGIEPAAASKRFGRVLLRLQQELTLRGIVATGG